MIALIELTCVVTLWGEHVLICLSDFHGEKMSLRHQSGEAGCNQQRQAVTGQKASVVGLGSAFSLCQTVFWHRLYPHILPTEHGHSLAFAKGIALRGGSCFSHSQTFDTTLRPFASVFSGVAQYVVSWQHPNTFRSFTPVKV